VRPTLTAAAPKNLKFSDLRFSSPHLRRRFKISALRLSNNLSCFPDFHLYNNHQRAAVAT
jgi:hypothetical protein